MKARMRKMTSIRTMVALALLIVSGFALAATREPASIQGQVDLGTFSGTATLTIGGDTLSGSVQVSLGAPPVVRDGRTYYPVVYHDFLFQGSTLQTIGAEFTEPTDENPAVLTLHGNMQIIDGTGVFEDASGALRVNGEMSIGQASFEARGVISR